jgi:hypothetical protein
MTALNMVVQVLFVGVVLVALGVGALVLLLRV